MADFVSARNTSSLSKRDVKPRHSACPPRYRLVVFLAYIKPLDNISLLLELV